MGSTQDIVSVFPVGGVFTSVRLSWLGVVIPLFRAVVVCVILL